MVWFTSSVPDVIEVDDLVVRRCHSSDASALVEAVTASLPELLQWMPWAKFEPQTVEQREQLIDTLNREWNEKSNFTMGIFAGNECIGGTGLHLRGDDGELEIGYWVSTPHTGRGVATRVSRALLDVAFSYPEVLKVAISHDVANVASGRIPQRLGFSVTKEYQREPEAISESGTVHVWKVTKEEWLSR